MSTKALARLFTALLVLAVAACDSGTDPGRDLGDFDPIARQAALENMVEILGPGAEARASLVSAWADLQADHGVQFDRGPAPHTLRALATGPGPALRLATFIPPEIRGRTFIFQAGADSWEVDEGRTGAPEDGLRIIYYATTQSGTIAFPLTERGFIEITDQDDEAFDRIGIRIVRTDGGQSVVADLTQRHRTTEGEQASTEEMLAIGAFSDGDRDVAFELASERHVPVEGDGYEEDFRVELARPGSTFTWTVAGSGQGASFDDDFVVTLQHNARTTTLQINLTGEGETPQPGTGTLTHDDVVIANLGISTSLQISASAPDGAPFSAVQRGQIEALAFAMWYYGVLIAGGVPIIF